MLIKHFELISLKGVFADCFVHGDAVVAAPAGGAIMIGGFFYAFEHSFDGEIGEAIDVEVIANFVDRFVVGDEFVVAGKIDAVKARVSDGGRGDAEMYFLGSSAAEGAHFSFGGGSADDGILDDDEPFVFDDLFNDVEFHAYGEVAHGLFGFDKASTGVVADGKASSVWDAAFFAVSAGGTAGAVGHGDDEVGFDGCFFGELFTVGGSYHVYVFVEDGAGGVGEIDLFEDTVCRCHGVGPVEETAMEAFFVDSDDFAGFDLSNEFGLDDIEGTGFRGDDVGPIAELANA